MNLDYNISTREYVYLSIRVLLSSVFYIFSLFSLKSLYVTGIPEEYATLVYIYCTYAALIILFIFVQHGALVGYIKGNAIKASPTQLPELYEIVTDYSKKLGLKKAPCTYVLQGNGALNAFATRFASRNFVVILADLMETASQEGNKTVEFIVAHELGHIKRKHTSFLKSLFLFPSCFIPFLNKAYSRACEYTCDSIANSLCPEGSTTGLITLVAGKQLHKRVNVEEYISNSEREKGFWKWYAELRSTHPNLPKRIKACLS
ncbi:MAG: Zn-dependent protease with chaperone function [Chlamydiales bacterium]|jgi:Zn-dependent protease with chaperone function